MAVASFSLSIHKLLMHFATKTSKFGKLSLPKAGPPQKTAMMGQGSPVHIQFSESP